MTKWPKWLILLIGTSGIFTSFLIQGFVQEAIYTKYRFKQSIFFTFVQFIGYFVLTVPYFFQVITMKVALHTTVQFYSSISFALVLSMGLSNFAVERLSYPTAVLFKSSKLIPVMIGSMIFLRKRYSVLEILSVFIVVAGLIGISLSDKKSNNKFDLSGILFSVISLIADAFSSNMQDKVLHQYHAPQTEVISIMYFIGALFLFIMALLSGQLYRGIVQCIENPILFGYIVLFSLLGSIGVQFVYLLMKAFGGLITVMVTSTRKAFTVCLSFFLFPNKKFTMSHLISILTIASGLALNYIGKERTKQRQNKENLPSAHFSK